MQSPTAPSVHNDHLRQWRKTGKGQAAGEGHNHLPTEQFVQLSHLEQLQVVILSTLEQT